MRNCCVFEQFFWVSCAAHFLFVTLIRISNNIITLLLQISIFMGDLWALHLIFRHCAKSTIWNLVNLLNTFLRHSLRILSFSRNSCTFFVVFCVLCNPFAQMNCANSTCYMAKRSAKFGQKIEECLIHSSQPGLCTFILLPYNVPAERHRQRRRPAARPG